MGCDPKVASWLQEESASNVGRRLCYSTPVATDDLPEQEIPKRQVKKDVLDELPTVHDLIADLCVGRVRTR